MDDVEKNIDEEMNCRLVVAVDMKNKIMVGKVL